MNLDRPTVAFTIGMFNAIDGPSYCVYTQAYGLEMTIDDEWEVNTIIMAPPHLMASMTEQADIASMGVIPGASYTPGNGDYLQIVAHGGRWVLARPADNISQILSANLGVLLLIEGVEELDAVLSNKHLEPTNFIVAFPINSVSTVKSAQATAAAIRTRLKKSSAKRAQILVSACFEHKKLPDYASLRNVSGLLMLDASYEQVVDLLPKIAGAK